MVYGRLIGDRPCALLDYCCSDGAGNLLFHLWFKVGRLRGSMHGFGAKNAHRTCTCVPGAWCAAPHIQHLLKFSARCKGARPPSLVVYKDAKH